MRIAMVLAGTSLALASVACSGGDPETDVPSTTLSPIDLPAGTPESFAKDVDAADLPPEALVPAGTFPSELWPVIAPDGMQFALVTFA